jgi:hypothetical protein
MGYVQEALLCFNRGCYTAAVLLLGITAEAVVLKLSEHFAASTDIDAARNLVIGYLAARICASPRFWESGA